MKSRKEMNSRFFWKPEHLYASEEAFNKDFERVAEIINELETFSGKLSDKDSAEKYLKIYFEALQKAMELDSYAARCKDVDMGDSKFQELHGKTENIIAKLSAASSFAEPEFLECDEDYLKSLKNDANLKDYNRYFEAILKGKPHTLSSNEERIMATYSSIGLGQYETYSTFSSSDMPFPKITLSNGDEIEVNTPNYSIHRGSDNREDRINIFQSYWKNYAKFTNTLAKTLNYQIKYYSIVSALRKFDTTLESQMFANELPKEFFYTLRDNIREIIPSLHNYLDVKKKVLGLDDLAYHDVYASMVKSETKKKYNYNESVDIINKALEVMPEEYRKIVAEGMNEANGWVDVYPNKGKRGGAYMSGEAYSTHPYVLLNHTDDYNSMSTIAHEFGHAMHSWYSNKCQPFSKSQYTIFVAEVASIFNEILLINYMIDNTEDEMEKMELLNHFIEMLRATVFRQMHFAEFEDNIYKRVEADGTLTPDFLTENYGNLLKDYYGHNRNIMKIDEEYCVEWAFIPHFYYNYYVYQYVVGYLGALTLATKVLDKTITSEHYVNNFLKAGSSKPPLEIIKDAGADLTSKDTYELVAKLFNKRLKEFEELAAKHK